MACFGVREPYQRKSAIPDILVPSSIKSDIDVTLILPANDGCKSRRPFPLPTRNLEPLPSQVHRKSAFEGIECESQYYYDVNRGLSRQWSSSCQ